jgi:hypothetical protein
MPPDVEANAFANEDIAIYLGGQPNSMQNIYNDAANWTNVLTINCVWFTNAYEQFMDCCWIPFDTNHWAMNPAAYGATLLPLPCTCNWLGLTWTTPDIGFGLQAGTDVGNTNSWIDLTNEQAGVIIPATARLVPIQTGPTLNAEFAANGKGTPSNKLYLRLKSPYP